MAIPRAKTAVTLFLVLWVICLITVCVIGASILNYNSETLDNATIASIAVTLVSATLTIVYLILQAIHVSQLSKQSWTSKTWLATTCIHLPRALIVCWLTATVVGSAGTIKRTACQNIHNRVADVRGQASSSCWLFRIMIIIDALQFALAFWLHWMLQVLGHDVPVSLISLKYSTTRKRRTMLWSPNGSSATLHNLIEEPISSTYSVQAEKYHVRRYSLSQDSFNTANSLVSGSGPPAYHNSIGHSTFDTPTPTSRYTSRPLVRDTSSLFNDAHSIFTPDSSLHSTMARIHDQARPLSDIPSISTPVGESLTARYNDGYGQSHSRQQHMSLAPSAYTPSGHELEVNTGKIQLKKAIHRAALYNIASEGTKKSLVASLVYSNSHVGRPTPTRASTLEHESNVAVPVSEVPQAIYGRYKGEILRSHNKSQISLALPTHDSEPGNELTLPPLRSRGNARPRDRHTDPAPPTWYPSPLRHAPLSADPAIRNLSSPEELAKRASQMSRLKFDFKTNTSGTVAGHGAYIGESDSNDCNILDGLRGSRRGSTIIQAPREFRVRKNRAGMITSHRISKQPIEIHADGSDSDGENLITDQKKNGLNDFTNGTTPSLKSSKHFCTKMSGIDEQDSVSSSRESKRVSISRAPSPSKIRAVRVPKVVDRRRFETLPR